MKITDEELMAYADGELSPLEAKRIEAAMAEDKALAARVARFRSVRRALRTAYDSVVSEPIPEHLRALLGDMAASEPVDLPPPRAAASVSNLAVERERRRGGFGAPAWAAMAACLMVGLLVGRATLQDSQALLTADGAYAGPTLAHALETQLASAEADSATRIGLTFRTQDGGVCRTFTSVSDAAQTSGLACRDASRWAIRMALTEPAQSTGGYQQAAVQAPAVLEAVDAIIAGDPLDADEERALRDQRWRQQD